MLNTGQSTSNNFGFFSAQNFTTGSTSNGYTVKEIKVEFRDHSINNGRSTSVKIRKNSSSLPDFGSTGLVATLTKSGSANLRGVITFTAPDNTTLEANTTYWVSLNEGIDTKPQNSYTNSNSEDSGGQSGWSIGDTSLRRSTESTNWSNDSRSIKIAVRGYATPLSASVSLSVTPNPVAEGSSVMVTATLSQALGSAVTIPLVLTPGTAEAGDYGTLANITIPAGQTSATDTISTTADADDDDETFTVALGTPLPNNVQSGTPNSVTVTISEGSSEAVKGAAKLALSEIARASLLGAADVIGVRFNASPNTNELTIAGHPVGIGLYTESHIFGSPDPWHVPSYEVRSLDASALLHESAFSMTSKGGAVGDSGETVWLRGNYREFKDRSEPAHWDGSSTSGWLGTDVRTEDGNLVGIAVSANTGEADYGVAEDKGRMKATLRTVWPYLQSRMSGGGSIRMIIGFGSGELKFHNPSEPKHSKANLSMRAGLVGGNWPFAQHGNAEISAVADTGAVRMKVSEIAEELVGRKVSVWHMRAGVEARHSGNSPPGAKWSVSPRGSVKMRRDGGDGVTGIGIELAGGIGFSSVASRFSADLNVHWLSLHSENDQEEWSVGFEARLDPDTGGQGLSLSFGQHLGTSRDEKALDGDGAFRETHPAESEAVSLHASAGYGIWVPNGVLTPFVETGVSHDSMEARHYAAGIQFESPDGLTASMELGRSKTKGQSPGNSFDLRLSLPF